MFKFQWMKWNQVKWNEVKLTEWNETYEWMYVCIAPEHMRWELQITDHIGCTKRFRFRY